MTLQLQQIDELLRPQHAFLAEGDHCFFLREYTAGVGFGYGETNNIISNLKKKLDRRGKPEWRYKEGAIQRAGNELREALTDHLLRQFTIVPMPPSKSKAHPMYDDRVLRIVRVMTDGLGCDVRELVVQPTDMPAAHETKIRPRPEEWYAAYAIDDALAAPPPTSVLVIDDVLTAGAHFVGLNGDWWSASLTSRSSVCSMRAALCSEISRSDRATSVAPRKSPAVVSTNPLYASLTVNEFLARLHEYTPERANATRSRPHRSA